jgi:hypothetical protein
MLISDEANVLTIVMCKLNNVLDNTQVQVYGTGNVLHLRKKNMIKLLV